MDKSRLKRFYVVADNSLFYSHRTIWMKSGNNEYIHGPTAVNWIYNNIPLAPLPSESLLSPRIRKKLIPEDFDKYYKYRLLYVLRKFELIPKNMHLTI